jgi:CheY-like chemotaxis protein
MKAAQFKAKRADIARFFAGLFGQERPLVQPASPEPQAKVSYPESVLVIDDDPVFMKATEMKLNSAGYGLIAATDSSEAIAALGEFQPRLVLVDVNLPPDVENGGMFGWDGFRLVRWLKGLQNAGQAKFVMISATESASCKQQARSCGAVDFLTKPLDYQKVLSLLPEPAAPK